jgi:hypothetical protein
MRRDGYPVGIRRRVNDHMLGGQDPHGFPEVARHIVEVGFDFIALTDGNYNLHRRGIADREVVGGRRSTASYVGELGARSRDDACFDHKEGESDEAHAHVHCRMLMARPHQCASAHAARSTRACQSVRASAAAWWMAGRMPFVPVTSPTLWRRHGPPSAATYSPSSRFGWP